MCYRASPCTPCVTPFKSLQMPQTKVSLRRLHSQRLMVSSRKSVTCKISGAKFSSFGFKTVLTCDAGPDRFSCHRQHHSCSLHKQGERYEVRFTLCPSMASPLLQSQTNCPQSQTHSRSPESDCRHIVSPGSGNLDRMVPQTGGVQPSNGPSLCPQFPIHRLGLWMP